MNSGLQQQAHGRKEASTTAKIMEIVAKETKGKSYHTYKYIYDAVGLRQEKLAGIQCWLFTVEDDFQGK